MNSLTNRWGLLALALTIIALCGALVLVLVPAPKTPIETATSTQSQATSSGQIGTSTEDLSDLIVVDSPKPGTVLSTTTITATGQARGSWYFEGSFPVYVADWSGHIIAQGHAQAQGNWMTDDFVPFSATLTFTVPTTGDLSVNRGMLIFHNDNPSGDPARDKALEVPVYFK